MKFEIRCTNSLPLDEYESSLNRYEPEYLTDSNENSYAIITVKDLEKMMLLKSELSFPIIIFDEEEIRSNVCPATSLPQILIKDGEVE